MLTATRSRRLRRSCRAASRGRAATTPAKDPPILLSPITTPIATDGDPGEPFPAGVSSFAGRTITGRRHPAASVPASSRSSREHWALALEAARGGQCLGGRRSHSSPFSPCSSHSSPSPFASASSSSSLPLFFPSLLRRHSQGRSFGRRKVRSFWLFCFSCSVSDTFSALAVHRRRAAEGGAAELRRGGRGQAVEGGAEQVQGGRRRGSRGRGGRQGGRGRDDAGRKRG